MTKTRQPSICLIGLGANLTCPAEQLTRACQLLAEIAGARIVSCSRWYNTLPIGGPGQQPPFANGVVRVAVTLPPHALLHAMLDVEQQLGRVRAERWGPRSLDLDLLWYDGLRLRTPTLVLPHPRWVARRFAMFPAAEVGPELRHPNTGWTIAEHAAHLRYAIPLVVLRGSDAEHRRRLADAVAQRIDAHVVHPNCQTPEAEDRPDATCEWQRLWRQQLAKLDWRQMPRPVILSVGLPEGDDVTPTRDWLATQTERIPPPKLVVQLRDAPRSDGAPIGAAEPATATESATAKGPAMASPSAALDQRGGAPVLDVDWGSWEQLVDDVAAAIQAMQQKIT